MLEVKLGMSREKSLARSFRSLEIGLELLKEHHVYGTKTPRVATCEFFIPPIGLVDPIFGCLETKIYTKIDPL